MTEKRFTIDFENRVITDTITNEDYSTLIQFKELLNGLNDENEQLRARIQYLERKIERERNSHIKQHEKWEKEIKDENDQLKQRNNRQAKQLDRLYNLIEEKDWRTLSDILDDFKRCEEQLQKEWGTYGDVE